MEKEKLIEKVSYPSKYDKIPKSNLSYVLTQKGKNFIHQKYGIGRCQNAYAIEHNCKVAEVICSLDKREIETVQAEWETRNQMEEVLQQMKQEGDYDRYDFYMDLWKTGRISAVDVVYTSARTGEKVFCEVITNHYKETDMEAKEACGELLQGQVMYVKA